MTPIRSILDRIDAIATPDDVVRHLREEFAAGRGEVFFVQPAGRHEARLDGDRLRASQAGLALYRSAPTTSRTARTAPSRRSAPRTSRISAASFRNAGITQADAERQAADVLAVRRALAAASLSPIALRDPLNRYHWVTLAEADGATPRFSWSEFMRSQGLAVRGFSLSQPKFFAEIDAMLADVPVAQWQAYLRRARDRRDGAVPVRCVRRRAVRLLRTDAPRPDSGRSRAGSACCRRWRARSARRSASATSSGGSRRRRRPRWKRSSRTCARR